MLLRIDTLAMPSVYLPASRFGTPPAELVSDLVGMLRGHCDVFASVHNLATPRRCALELKNCSQDTI
jgi:hypothetical protein